MNSPRPEEDRCPFCGHAQTHDSADPPGTIFACPQCAGRRVLPFTLGGLEVHAILRTGGMGTIYLAWDPPLHRWVAVKVIREDLAHQPEFREAFRREARIAATLSHPNVIRIYAFGEEQGIPFLVMEHVTAETLAERIDREGPLPYPVWIRLAEGLTAALEFMAQRGVFHCDIKPGNILLEPSGAVRLTDFGLAMASVDDSSSATAAQIWGTPYYLAPERARGDPVSERGEIYSLGATLYHAAMGKPPVDGPTVEDLLASLRSGAQQVVLPPTASRHLPARASALLLSMLSPDPVRRPPTFSATMAALHELPRTLAPRRPRKMTIIIVILMVVAMQGVVIWMAVRRAGQGTQREPAGEEQTEPTPGDESAEAITPPPAQPKPETPAAPAAPASEPATPPQDLPPQAGVWEKARQLLAAGTLAEALPVLEPLATGDPPGPEALPYRHLAQLWGALGRLAAGEKEQAEAALKSLLEEIGKLDPAAGLTADSATAAAAAGLALGTPAPEPIASKADPRQAAALGALMQALRAMGGDPAKALAPLQALAEELKQAGPVWWQPPLQGIAGALAASVDLQAKARAAAAEREGAGDLAGAAEALRTAATSISPAAWGGGLLAEVKRLEEKAAAAEREQQQQLKRNEVERWKQERTKVEELDQTISPLIAQLEFGQAAQQVELLLARVQTELIAERLRSQLAYLRAAEKVIHSMVVSVARHLGFNAAVRTRAGPTVTGLVQQITRRDISLQTPTTGSVVLRWNDVVLASVLEVALQGFLLDEQEEGVSPGEHRARFSALGELARAWRAPSIAERALRRAQFWEDQLPGQPSDQPVAERASPPAQP